MTFIYNILTSRFLCVWSKKRRLTWNGLYYLFTIQSALHHIPLTIPHHLKHPSEEMRMNFILTNNFFIFVHRKMFNSLRLTIMLITISVILFFSPVNTKPVSSFAPPYSSSFSRSPLSANRIIEMHHCCDRDQELRLISETKHKIYQSLELITQPLWDVLADNLKSFTGKSEMCTVNVSILINPVIDWRGIVEKFWLKNPPNSLSKSLASLFFHLMDLIADSVTLAWCNLCLKFEGSQLLRLSHFLLIRLKLIKLIIAINRDQLMIHWLAIMARSWGLFTYNHQKRAYIITIWNIDSFTLERIWDLLLSNIHFHFIQDVIWSPRQSWEN